MTTIKLESNDKQIREISREIGLMSGTIKELQELVEMGECVDSSPIPLFNINSIVLDKVIVWLNYHYNNQNKSFAETNDWDQSFFNCDQQMLFQLLLAANYLNIKDMLSIGCKFAAKQIDGKSTEEVRKLWGIVSDYSPEEEEKLRIDNEWTDYASNDRQTEQ